MDWDGQSEEESALEAAPERPVEVLEYARPGRSHVATENRPPVVRIIVWGLLLLPLILLLAYPVALLLPFGWETHTVTKIPVNRPGQYGGNAAFHVVAFGTGRGTWTQMNRGYINYSGHEYFLVLFDLRSMTYDHTISKREAFDQPIEVESVKEHLVTAGFDPITASESADAIVTDLRTLAASELEAGSPPISAGRRTTEVYHSLKGTAAINLGMFGHLLWWPWYTVYCLPLWICGWLLLGRWLMRRYRVSVDQALLTEGRLYKAEAQSSAVKLDSRHGA